MKSRAARARTALRDALDHGRPRPSPSRRPAPDPEPAPVGRPGPRIVPAGPTPRPARPSFDEALAQLTVGQREAVTAIDLEGLSVTAAARRAGVGAETMRERWHRAQANLQRLQGHGPAGLSPWTRPGPTG